jgi:cyclophilin family peptidyl-prolyl cis-trans isomerase
MERGYTRMAVPAPRQEQCVKKATIHTRFGTMTLRFFPDKAPKHVENFLDLAAKGFYDGRTFHRIVDGFMIQGGCPKGDGTGNGPRRLPAEFNDTPHDLGVLSMARANDPNSASCQFFICLDRCDFLDGQYTAFGRLDDEDSVKTLKKIGKVKVRDAGTGEASSPVEPVKIDKVTVQEVEEKK